MTTDTHLPTPAADGARPRPRTAPGSTGDLGGRTAVVTGAASGIGRACAVHLALAGATVRAVDRDADGLAGLADEVPVRTEVLDLTDLDAAETAGRGADILVNNAGIQLVRPIEEFPPEEFTTILTLMLHAPFRLIRGALPHMYGQGRGRIINVSSVHGLRASAYKSAYVAAKHGLEGLSKVAALEGAAHGVTSNCVSPGYVRTPLVEKQIADQAATHGLPESEVISEIMLARTARKQLVEPAEVAAAVGFLCTDQAAAITGISLPLDGGWTAR
ncbi:3-hydroxybutyrate dehydrogenase [Streptomyces sp. SM12]|uniref:3-hydroxybutyrate dehydrogenase n=1 Tax=Streptomyces sp. SM12 TaxID=1071602 RepID=UPI000CD5B532|nr:3-hydroxybutyrate dehydrogenase [Streptomyces sp. SM12]